MYATNFVVICHFIILITMQLNIICDKSQFAASILPVRHIVHCDVKRPVQSRLVQSDTQIQFSEAIGLLKEVDFIPH